MTESTKDKIESIKAALKETIEECHGHCDSAYCELGVSMDIGKAEKALTTLQELETDIADEEMGGNSLENGLENQIAVAIRGVNQEVCYTACCVRTPCKWCEQADTYAQAAIKSLQADIASEEMVEKVDKLAELDK